jgi:hypothetical protein
MRRLSQGMLLPLSLLVMTGCAHDVVNDISHDMDQYLQAGGQNGTQWAGPVVPNDPNCGKPATGLMTLSFRKFSFDPFQSVTVIPGKVDHDRLEGSTTMAGQGQHGVTFQFTGTINRSTDPHSIQGTVTSGQCTWRVSLRPE